MESLVLNRLPPLPGTRFEMTCDPSDPAFLNDVNVFQDVQSFQSQLDGLLGNLSEYSHIDPALPNPYSGVVGDSRIRLVPYNTGPRIGAVSCSALPGAYIWDSYSNLTNSGFLSNSSNLNIIVYGDYKTGICTAGGSAALAGTRIDLYSHLIQNPTTGQVPIKANVAYVILHELVHTSGQQHAFVSNVCTGIDLGDPSVFYSEVEETSNNVMDYEGPGTSPNVPLGTIAQVSLSPCQWSTFYCEMANRYSTGVCEKQNGVTQIFGNETIGVFGSQIPRTINQNIEITAGADLTITGEVKIAPDVAIVVRRGGRITIDNAAITSCDSDGRWEGIFIEGNFDLEQPDEGSFPMASEAGVARVYSSSLSDAETVLRTLRFDPEDDYFASWDQAYWGGAIYVRDSEFRNNKRVAEFMKYEKNNKSLFHTSQFYGEQDATRSDRAITAWATRGVEIDAGCTFNDFENEAIYSVNAFFEIKNSAFRDNQESIVLEYTRSHLSSSFKNFIISNELSNNLGAIAIVSSDYQFRNSSTISDNFIVSSEGYYLETYGRGLININNNSFFGTTGDAFIWSIHPSIDGSSINCNVLSGSGGKFIGLAVSGNQSGTSIEGNVMSGLNTALHFRRSGSLFFYPKPTQGSPSDSHGNYWVGNNYDVWRDGNRGVRNHAFMTFFSHTFDQGQTNSFNPNESFTYGGNQRVVMDRAFFENECTEDLEINNPDPPTSFPCDDFAFGGLSPEHPYQKSNLSSLYLMLKEAYDATPIDGSSIVDLVDCLIDEDKIRLYYLSLNFTHDQRLFGAVRNSESLSYSDIAGLDRARQVWLFENAILEDEELLDYYEVTCSDSKLAMPYLREHNFVIHSKISSPDYLSCSDRTDEGEILEAQNDENGTGGSDAIHSCETSCKNIFYSLVDLVSGEEKSVLEPSKLSKFDFDKPYRFLKVSCSDHGVSLIRKVE